VVPYRFACYYILDVEKAFDAFYPKKERKKKRKTHLFGFFQEKKSWQPWAL
jgi:hypothetical protein